MANFSKVVTVSATSYSTLPDVEIPFVPKRIRVMNMDEADVGYVSLDGRVDAVALLDDVKSPSSSHEWMWQISQKVWLRTAGNAVQVQVVAEA